MLLQKYNSCLFGNISFKSKSNIFWQIRKFQFCLETTETANFDFPATPGI